VQQVEPEHFAGLFHAHQTELQSARGENESKDFILEHVYQLTPRSIRNPVDFWRELLRMHFANRSLPPLFAQHAAGIIQGKGCSRICPSPHGWHPRARCCAWCRMRGIAI
jgi:hypothetical protein